MSCHLVTLALILAVSVVQQGFASRILAIFPYPSISHQIVYRGLTLALMERGHELVVITPDPINDPTLKNYTEIDMHFLYEDGNEISNRVATRNEATWLGKVQDSADKFMLMTERILSHSVLKKMYAPNSEEKFDLVIIETLFWQALLPLAKRFDVPVIGIAPFGLPLHIQYRIGNPIMPSHPSHWDVDIKVLGQLALWQRLWNFVYACRVLYYFETDYLPRQQMMARKYFGSNIPDIADIEKNISLIFVNQQAPISFVRPNVPKVINIGGFRVSRQIEPLSQDLQNILDEATQGFIYMNLGTNFKSTMLSNKTRGEFLAAFSQLPYIVIWNLENDLLPDRPDNVITMKWTPQQAILAHPNIKAFIYQGGAQSTEEAVSHAVPVIGLPVFWDQETQVHKMVSLGVGKKLEILTVNRMDLMETIQSVVLESSYKQRMLKLRDLMRDKPYDSLQNAVWWTEHVIRHRGAPQLHSTTADDPWYQRQDIDLIFFITTATLTTLTATIVAVYKLLVHSIHALKYKLVFKKKEKAC